MTTQTDVLTAELSVKGVTHRFPSSAHGGELTVLRDVDFHVASGEFVVIVGPSGCGKSTILSIVSGLLEPSSGHVLIDGEEVADRRGFFGYMFQNDLLLPWENIQGNVALGIEILGTPKKEARSQALEILEEFGLGKFADKYPSQLSGGMRQRAAFMRTLLCHRPILLLDEPFGALDALNRSVMQEWLLSVWERTKRTILLITHDIEEAVFLADRVILMTSRPGRINRQLKVPLERPRTHSILTSQEFTDIKREIFEELFTEAARVDDGPVPS